ncbi:MAG: hypothetical protein PVF33_02140 [Candidatus Latescibacterota bacterium]|jgi:hypothetical protein
MAETQERKTPLHLWIVGIVSLLWNLMGAFDYIMTQTQNEAYMGQFSPEQLEFFYSFPAWLVAFWALAVWGSVLGSVLLLLRKKWAAPVFIVSFLCMVITSIRNYGFAGGAEIMGGMGLLFSVVIFVVALALVVYARGMAGKGVLT